MVQPSAFLGRSILTSKPTPRPRPTARRTGNWQPPRRENGPEHKRSDSAVSPSESQYGRLNAPPAVKLTGTLPNRNTTRSTQSARKGEVPNASLNNASAPPQRQVRTSFPDRSVSSSASQHADTRPGISKVDSAPEPSRVAVNRYQAEFDRLEQERDMEDSTFVDSQSQIGRSTFVISRSSSVESQEIGQDSLVKPHNATHSSRIVVLPVQSKRRSTGTLFSEAEPARQNRPARPELVTQPAQQKRAVHQVPAEAVAQQNRTVHLVPTAAVAQPTQHKRAANQDAAAEEPLMKKKRQRDNFHHRNTRYENLKPASQAKRKQAVETLKSIWTITDARLMDLPSAPRRTTDFGRPIMAPLDWNIPLLQALVQLAEVTKGDFVRACAAATEAYQHESLFNGATQLNAEIVAVAVGGLRGGGLQRASAMPSGTPRPVAVTTTAAPAPSAGSQRAPPSPAATPVASPAVSPKVSVKIESQTQSFGPRRSTFALDEESSGAEDIDILEAKARLRKIEYDLACERVRVSKLERKKRQGDVERMRLHGGSAEDALCL